MAYLREMIIPRQYVAHHSASAISLRRPHNPTGHFQDSFYDLGFSEHYPPNKDPSRVETSSSINDGSPRRNHRAKFSARLTSEIQQIQRLRGPSEPDLANPANRRTPRSFVTHACKHFKILREVSLRAGTLTLTLTLAGTLSVWTTHFTIWTTNFTMARFHVTRATFLALHGLGARAKGGPSHKPVAMSWRSHNRPIGAASFGGRRFLTRCRPPHRTCFSSLATNTQNPAL
jgi:hypothetical protein